MISEISRRDVLKLGGAALATSVAGGLAAVTAAEAASSSNVLIVDTGHGTNAAFLRPLADNGVQTIFRYYAQEDNIPGKNITPRERDMIFDHGLSLAIVYQHKAYLRDRFTARTGDRDARFVLGRAREIRQPRGSAIFFAVDSDAHTPADVIAYLRAVRRVIGNRYEIGCYGSGTNCAAAVNAGLATLSWVATSPAWGGTRAFINSGGWHLYQNKVQIESNPIMSAGRVPIDTNIINPRFDSVGAFDRRGDRVRYDPARLRIAYERRMFVAANQLNVREKPEGRVIAQLCSARTVHVLRISNGWAQVDLEEDGRANGWCCADYLRPIHEMPDYTPGCSPMAV